jgi:hypothetical protein
MTNATGWKVGALVVCVLVLAVTPASAQLADPLSLAASGVILPFFGDPAAGFVSILEIASPVVPAGFTNPLHLVFFRENCSRDGSVGDVETAKQAKAFITSATRFQVNFNGLVAIGNSLQDNDLVPLSWVHTRTHWIDVKTGRLRELEPIILDAFSALAPGFLPLAEPPDDSASIGLCNSPSAPGGSGFCWSPLRSAATFVTPQETASVKATIYLICPTADIQGGNTVTTNSGVFNPANGFPRIQNRDGTFGFPARSVATGDNVTSLRARVYDDDEALVRDITVPCACLSATPILSIDTVYSSPPVNLGANTVPVWYTELETTSVNPDPTSKPSLAQQFSFTGYWGLEVEGKAGTRFRRLSNASLDNLASGASNANSNR